LLGLLQRGHDLVGELVRGGPIGAQPDGRNLLVQVAPLVEEGLHPRPYVAQQQRAELVEARTPRRGRHADLEPDDGQPPQR